MIVYTLGHSNRGIDDFIEILRKFNIRSVVDVRRFPTSRKYPWFNMENLRDTLSKIGVKYYWLGEDLGGYREGGYQKYMASSSYSTGIRKLIEVIEDTEGFTAILCSEKLWFRCHRRFISDTLTEKGYTVVHIIDSRRTYTHKKLLHR